jgi:hypothetical protein
MQKEIFIVTLFFFSMFCFAQDCAEGEYNHEHTIEVERRQLTSDEYWQLVVESLPTVLYEGFAPSWAEGATSSRRWQRNFPFSELVTISGDVLKINSNTANYACFYFFSPDCVACVEHHDFINKLWKDYINEETYFVGIGRDADTTVLLNYKSEYKILYNLVAKKEII